MIFAITCPLGEHQGYEITATPMVGLILPYRSFCDLDMTVPKGLHASRWCCSEVADHESVPLPNELIHR